MRDGGVVVSGTFDGLVYPGGTVLAGGEQPEGFLARYSAAGAHVWAQKLGGPISPIGGYLAVDGNDEIAVAGTVFDVASFNAGGATLPTMGEDIFAVKLSPEGQHVWSTTLLGSDFDDGATALATTREGHVIVGGFFYGTMPAPGCTIPDGAHGSIVLTELQAPATCAWAPSERHICLQDWAATPRRHPGRLGPGVVGRGGHE